MSSIEFSNTNLSGTQIGLTPNPEGAVTTQPAVIEQTGGTQSAAMSMALVGDTIFTMGDSITSIPTGQGVINSNVMLDAGSRQDAHFNFQSPHFSQAIGDMISNQLTSRLNARDAAMEAHIETSLGSLKGDLRTMMAEVMGTSKNLSATDTVSSHSRREKRRQVPAHGPEDPLRGKRYAPAGASGWAGGNNEKSAFPPSQDQVTTSSSLPVNSDAVSIGVGSEYSDFSDGSGDDSETDSAMEEESQCSRLKSVIGQVLPGNQTPLTSDQRAPLLPINNSQVAQNQIGVAERSPVPELNPEMKAMLRAAVPVEKTGKPISEALVPHLRDLWINPLHDTVVKSVREQALTPQNATFLRCQRTNELIFGMARSTSRDQDHSLQKKQGLVVEAATLVAHAMSQLEAGLAKTGGNTELTNNMFQTLTGVFTLLSQANSDMVADRKSKIARGLPREYAGIRKVNFPEEPLLFGDDKGLEAVLATIKKSFTMRPSAPHAENAPRKQQKSKNWSGQSARTKGRNGGKENRGGGFPNKHKRRRGFGKNRNGNGNNSNNKPSNNLKQDQEEEA
jgi:hypothetical protein